MNGNIDVLELNGQLDDYVSVEGTLIFGSGDMMKAIYDTNDNGIVDNAEMVNNHTVLTDVPADAVFTDTTYTAGTGISIQDGVISNTQTSAEWGNITGTLADQTDLKLALDSKASTSDIPTKVSDLDNDTGFITNAVNNLINYYNTTNSYSKTEVDTLISNINQFKLEVVQTLPVSDIDTHTIYLVPKTGSTGDVYNEYIYINNAWELIGNTEVDLTNYVQKTDYGNSNTAGIIRGNDLYGFVLQSYGTPMSDHFNWATYSSTLSQDAFISKGTLDNVLQHYNYAEMTDLNLGLSTKQDTLVSGTNIKTINSTSLLGSGDISLEATPEISISTTQPSEDEVLWINPEETPSGSLNPITNEYSVAQDKGYSCNYVNNANTYSTSEVKTDMTWIDGKPIYRKVITMQNQAVAQVSVGAISNLDSIVSLNGILISSTLKNIMGSHNDDSNYTSRLYMYGNELYYQQGSGWQSTSYDIQVIVEYTKTTD